jgi:vancomycin permeability regulator SanA
MAIIKIKGIYNAKNIHLIHHGYRTVASILRANSANRFCVFLIIKTQKKNAY